MAQSQNKKKSKNIEKEWIYFENSIKSKSRFKKLIHESKKESKRQHNLVDNEIFDEDRLKDKLWGNPGLNNL